LTTKQRILSHALASFNQSGFGPVNLFELAKSLEMSRGNMTYHFKDKDALLEALADELWEKMEGLKSHRGIPSFQNLHHDVQLYYRLQEEYSFIFQDNHVLAHPLIVEKMRAFSQKTVAHMKVAITFSIQLGNMNPEPAPGIYNHLALTSWMLMFYWSSQQKIRGEESRENGEKAIWSLLIPHFTPKGINSFKKFFGESYYDSLGEPFAQNIESYISF